MNISFSTLIKGLSRGAYCYHESPEVSDYFQQVGIRVFCAIRSLWQLQDLLDIYPVVRTFHRYVPQAGDDYDYGLESDVHSRLLGIVTLLCLCIPVEDVSVRQIAVWCRVVLDIEIHSISNVLADLVEDELLLLSTSGRVRPNYPMYLLRIDSRLLD